MKNLACGLENTALLSSLVENEPRVRSETSGTLKLIVNTVNLWLERSESRRQLRRLDDRMLTDVGLSRQQAQNEANKPFWHE